MVFKFSLNQDVLLWLKPLLSKKDLGLISGLLETRYPVFICPNIAILLGQMKQTFGWIISLKCLIMSEILFFCFIFWAAILWERFPRPDTSIHASMYNVQLIQVVCPHQQKVYTYNHNTHTQHTCTVQTHTYKYWLLLTIPRRLANPALGAETVRVISQEPE